MGTIDPGQPGPGSHPSGVILVFAAVRAVRNATSGEIAADAGLVEAGKVLDSASRLTCVETDVDPLTAETMFFFPPLRRSGGKSRCAPRSPLIRGSAQLKPDLIAL
jgi:hypothetical protein